MDPEVQASEVVPLPADAEVSFALQYSRQVLTEQRAIQEFQSQVRALRNLGVRRLVFVGFEAPWEWNLHPAIRIAALIEPRGLDARFEVTEFLEAHFGREVHITNLLVREQRGEPDPAGVKIDGFE